MQEHQDIAARISMPLSVKSNAQMTANSYCFSPKYELPEYAQIPLDIVVDGAEGA